MCVKCSLSLCFFLVPFGSLFFFFFLRYRISFTGIVRELKETGGGGRDEAKSASNFARQCPLTRRRIPIVDEGKNSAHSL